MKMALVILAAGESSRMGEPKASLRIRDIPLLESHIREYSANGIGPISVVLGHKADHLMSTLDLSHVRVFLNNTYANGQFSSLQTGLRGILPHLDQGGNYGVLVTPVDCPPVSQRTLQILIDRFMRNPSLSAVLPLCRGKSGHPVLLSGKAITKILASPVTLALDNILGAMKESVDAVDVHDPEILWNINTPGDVQRYIESTSSRLWP